MRSSGSTYDAKRKGKEVYEENNNTMDFADFIAQRGNKGIVICEKSVNSRSEEMTNFMGTSNDHSSGQNLQFQNMNQVSPNNFLSNTIKEMSGGPRRHKPRIIVHPTTIVSPSRFSQNYDQNKPRNILYAPRNFSVLKLLMAEENIYTLTDEELLYAKELLSNDQGLSLEGQGAQQSPCSQTENQQNKQRTSESATTNFSHMKLLMEDEESSKLANELYEKQFLSTQYSLSSEGQMVQQWPYSQVGNNQFEYSSGGQMVQQWPDCQVGNYQSSGRQMMQQLPCSKVGNYQFESSSEGQMVQQLPYSQVGNYQSENLSEGQRVKQLPCSQVGNYQFESSSAGQMVPQLHNNQVGNYQFENSSGGQMLQQWPSSELGNYQFENSVQQINLQNLQNQELQQPQKTSYMDLLKRDDISYMDLLTRDDILCDDLLNREDISYMDLLTREDISWTLGA